MSVTYQLRSMTSLEIIARASRSCDERSEDDLPGAGFARLRERLLARHDSTPVHVFVPLASLFELDHHTLIVSLLDKLAAPPVLRLVLPTERAAALAQALARRFDLDGLLAALPFDEARHQMAALPASACLCICDAGCPVDTDYTEPLVREGENHIDYGIALRGDLDEDLRPLVDVNRAHERALSGFVAPSDAASPDGRKQLLGTAKIDIAWDGPELSIGVGGGLADRGAFVELIENGALLARKPLTQGKVRFLPLRARAGDQIAAEALLVSDRTILARAPARMNFLPDRLDPGAVTCFQNRGGSGNRMIRAMANAIGSELRYAEDRPIDPEGAVVIWGVLRGSNEVIERAESDGRTFYYVDHAYFGRGHGNNYRITRDRFEAGPVRLCPNDRLNALNIAVKDWHGAGDVVTVCPPTDHFMAAHGCPNWLDDTLAQLKLATDRPIVIRRKPQPGEIIESLEELFGHCWALVTHSSNIAVEAVVAGVPVFVAPTSAAAPVGLTDLSRIETPKRGKRAPWLAHLAYSQFSMNEVVDGTAWSILRAFERFPFARGDHS